MMMTIDYPPLITNNFFPLVEKNKNLVHNTYRLQCTLTVQLQLYGYQRLNFKYNQYPLQ